LPNPRTDDNDDNDDGDDGSTRAGLPCKLPKTKMQDEKREREVQNED